MNGCLSRMANHPPARIACSSLTALIPREWAQPYIALSRVVVPHKTLFSSQKRWMVVAVAWDMAQPSLVRVARFVAATLSQRTEKSPLATQSAYEHQRMLWWMIRVYVQARMAARLSCSLPIPEDHDWCIGPESHLDGSGIVLRNGQWRIEA